MKHYDTVLTIAGSDSGGGAGIQADIKTVSALGCYASSAITAVTVQNTLGVKAVSPVPVEIVEGQVRAVLDDIGAKAVKIGMLHTAEVAECVASLVREYHMNNVVLDPVMVSTSGHRLMESSAIEVLTTSLMPLARVITPNIPEAEMLLGGVSLLSADSLPSAVMQLADQFNTSVLLKAGHLEGDRLIDYFYDAEQGVMIELPSNRIHTPNTHGTGCTMSSAFAAFLAKGMTLQEAARGAKDYVNRAIAAGADYQIGHGHGPVRFS